MQITDQLRHEWSLHPVTKELVAELKATIQDAKDAWARQTFSDQLSNAAALGGVESLQSVIETIDAYTIKELEQ